MKLLRLLVILADHAIEIVAIEKKVMVLTPSHRRRPVTRLDQPTRVVAEPVGRAHRPPPPPAISPGILQRKRRNLNSLSCFVPC